MEKTKTYQPKVIEATDEFISVLKDINFFTDCGIDDDTPAREVLLDLFTEKFIKGELEKPYFTEEEGIKLLNEIEGLCVLRSLMKEGILNSYSDENTEELFFLSDLGKAITDEMSKVK